MKKWYEYEEFEDYWNEYLTTEQRHDTLEKIHRKGMNLDHMKSIWILHKEIVIRAEKLR